VRTIGAALINRSQAYRVEILNMGWRSFMHSQTGASTPSSPLGEIRRISACSGGVSVVGIPRDTTNATLPSEVEVKRWGTPTTNGVVRRFAWNLATGPGLQTSPRMFQVPIIGGVLMRGSTTRSGSSVEPFVLQEGEGISVYTPHVTGDGTTLVAIGCGPWALRAVVRVVSTGAIFDYDIGEIVAGYENCAVCIFNGSGSGVALEVLEVVATQTSTIVSGYSTAEFPKVGVFHIRKHARVVVDTDGFLRDVSSNIVPHDSARVLASGISAFAGAMPFDIFEHGDPTALGAAISGSAPSVDGASDPGSVGRIRRYYPWTGPRNAAPPLPIDGFGRLNDIISSRAAAAAVMEPIQLGPGEALGVGYAVPTTGFHGPESTSIGAWSFYIGDVEVMFRVLPARGRSEVRAA